MGLKTDSNWRLEADLARDGLKVVEWMTPGQRLLPLASGSFVTAQSPSCQQSFAAACPRVEGYVFKLYQQAPMLCTDRSIFNAQDTNDACRLLGLKQEG